MTWRMTVSICVAAMNELDSIVLERDHVTVLSLNCKIQQFLGPLSGPHVYCSQENCNGAKGSYNDF